MLFLGTRDGESQLICKAWGAYVVTHCPVLKFTRSFAEILDLQPEACYLKKVDGRWNLIEDWLKNSYKTSFFFPNA